MPENRTFLRLSAAAIMISCTVALVGCGADHAGDHPAAATSAAESAEQEVTFNAADVMFVQMMNPHHQQAIEMSDLLLAKDDVDSEVRTLAKQIKAAQGPEIDTMSEWAKDWGVSATPPPGHDHGTGDMGMLDQDQIAELRDADTEQATELYLTGMIEHHNGAIAMAEDEKADGKHPDAVALAEDIISTQQAEIDTMQKLLGQR